MTRPVAFDVTHLASRLPITTPSGIDKVDLAYADHFSRHPCCAAIHYGFRQARVHHADTIRELVTAGKSRWATTPAAADAAYQQVYSALAKLPKVASTTKPSITQAPTSAARRLAQLSWRFSQGSHRLPEGAIYLNVAQHAFEFPRFFNWLHSRGDIKPVFLVHDLLPLDWPEYFRPGYKQRFQRRAQTILTHASAIITTSSAVEERLRCEFARRGRQAVPIHVEPLPSPLAITGTHTDAQADPDLAAVPYFVIVGTIEPRKNHLLLLNIWRRLAETHPAPPKLVIVGNRGWENEQVIDVLDRSTLVRPHVIECAGLGDQGLLHLLSNARGLLMPSFAEGYGLPIVEALAAGVPVVASDIPVFREVSQGKAILRHPLDGPGWMQAILGLSDADGPLALEARSQARRYASPTWDGYFAGIANFLGRL